LRRNGAKFLKNTLRTLPFLLSLSAGLSYCSRTASVEQASASPKRIVSLVPSLTEVVYALGIPSRLVGVTTFCDYPPQVKEKPVVGDFLHPDPEKLASLKPAIILLTTPTQAQLAADLRAAGYRVAVFEDPATLEDVFAQIQALADTLGVGSRGRTLADSLRAGIAAIGTRESLSCYVEISDAPLLAAGASFLSDALERIGLYNVFSDRRGYPAIDPEEVLKREPQAVLLLYPNASSAKVASRMGWAQIPAVRNRMVFANLPLDELMRPGPRLIRGLIETDSLIRHAR
jgi:iron complex transport system substrate-binding protein